MQVIVPKSDFSCNGRVTGYLVSLKQQNRNSNNFPSIQVWHPTSPTEYTRVNTECALTASDISMMADSREDDYYLGNVSCTGSNRIEFQTGDVIGYRQDNPIRYLVWNINANGYTSYHNNANRQTSTFNINESFVTSTGDTQPLIQMIYGKINYVALCI